MGGRAKVLWTGRKRAKIFEMAKRANATSGPERGPVETQGATSEERGHGRDI